MNMEPVAEGGSAHATTPSMLITSILNALAATSSPLGVTNSNDTEVTEALRPLFSTLHLLFPHVLLDALDLLDRGLVTRFKVQSKKDTEIENKLNEEAQLYPSTGLVSPVTRAETTEPETNTRSGTEKGAELLTKKFYYVQSTQMLSHYRKFDRVNYQNLQDATSNESHRVVQTYQVHLDAWNCSCSAFAYAAFSNPTILESTAILADQRIPRRMNNLSDAHQRKHSHIGTGESIQWMSQAFVQFGGVIAALRTLNLASTHTIFSPTSTPSIPSIMPPVCKHLLACTLAEACPELFPIIVDSAGICLGGIVERVISSEEAAGWAPG